LLKQESFVSINQV